MSLTAPLGAAITDRPHPTRAPPTMTTVLMYQAVTGAALLCRESPTSAKERDRTWAEAKPVTKIVLSYRREDTAGHVGRLTDRLSARFGRDAVFRDLDSIAPGRDFTVAINEAIDSCDAVVVVIGREWLGAARPDGHRRLDDADDFVRVEVTAALERAVPVIPVLVEGAQMPAPESLPPPLVPLAYRNALEISDSRWDYDVQRLIDVLDPSSPETLTGSVPVVARHPRSRLLVVAAAGVVALAAAVVLFSQDDDAPSRVASRTSTTTFTEMTAAPTTAVVDVSQPLESIEQRAPDNPAPTQPAAAAIVVPTPTPTAPPITAAPAPGPSSADAVAGTWSGTASDGSGGSFTISLDVRPGCAVGETCGSVYVSANECLGDLIFYASSARAYEFTVANFSPTSGPSCSPGPGEYLTPQADGTLSYTTSYGPYGTLTRSS